MADRPILFSAPMIRALLEGRKTQTRRIMKPQPPRQEEFPHSPMGLGRAVADGVRMFSLNEYERLPKHPTKWDLDGAVGVARAAGFPKEYDARFAIGDRLWVREAYRVHRAYNGLKPSELGGDQDVWPELDRDNCDAHGRYRHARFMPRWASRLTLTVTDVRVQRLQACSAADAIAEGIAIGQPLPQVPNSRGDIYHDGATDPIDGWTRDPVEAYARLWNHINGAGAWEANPWVVAISFDVRKGNIDG